MFKKIQEEINLLVKQSHLIGKSEQIHLELINSGELEKAIILREKLDKIYPLYYNLLNKYTTNK